MRTAREIRSHFVEELRGAVRRPAMYCGGGRAVDLYFRGHLGHLGYIDGKETEEKAAIKALSQGVGPSG